MSLQRPQSLLLLVLLFMAVVTADCVWFAMDRRPPIWDMAVHMSAAFDFYQAFEHFSFSWGFFKGLALLGKFYPTLFPALMGLFFLIFHPSVYVGPAANFIPLALLIWATYGIGRKLFSERVGILAACLVVLYPIMAWEVREALLDFTTVALVAACGWVYLEAEVFSKRTVSLVYGLLVALGFLSKQVFIWYGFALGCFALWEIARAEGLSRFLRSPRFRNLIFAHAVGGALAAVWYLPHWSKLHEYYLVTLQKHYELHLPKFLTLSSSFYFLDALTSAQMLFIPFVCLVVATIVSLRRFPRRATILYFGGFGSLIIMTLTIVQRDVRMSGASLPFLAVLTAAGILEIPSTFWRRSLATILLASCLFEFELITFGWPQWPDSTTLLKTSFLEVNLFQRQYAHLVGPPKVEDWKIEAILESAANDALHQGIGSPSLAIVPDMPRFNLSDFVLYSQFDAIAVRSERLADLPEGRIPPTLNYVLLKSGSQGEPSTTQSNLEINQYVLQHPDRFQPIESFPLPDGSQALLYRQQRASGTPLSGAQREKPTQHFPGFCSSLLESSPHSV